MDRRLLERMIGAGVLVIAMIVIAPAMLDGERNWGLPDRAASGQSAEQNLRTHTIRLDQQPDGPPVAQALPGAEPEPEEPVTAAKRAAPVPAEKPRDKPANPVVAAKIKPQATSKPAPKSDPRSTRQAEAATKALPRPAAGWAVQLGAFSKSDSARRLEAEVQQRGFSSYVVTVELADKTIYRVRVGPEETRSQADRLAGKLANAGYKGGQVISQQPGS
jgi:cell division septation protein DedD